MQNDLKWKSHVQDIVKKASKRIYFVRACRKANLPSNIYRANNLLHKDKTHTGICGTNLSWLTILPKGGYRKSTKSLFRYHWLTEK